MEKERHKLWFMMGDIEEITMEEAKEIFFGFSCSFPDLYKEWLRHDIFDNLNIPKETIIDWTMEFYMPKMAKYEEMDVYNKKLFLGSFAHRTDQITKSFFLDVCNKYLDLLEDDSVYYVHDRIPIYIVSNMLSQSPRSNEFYGFIPTLFEYKEMELLEKFIYKAFEIISRFPKLFKTKYGSGLTEYELLILFIKTNKLQFEHIKNNEKED